MRGFLQQRRGIAPGLQVYAACRGHAAQAEAHAPLHRGLRVILQNRPKGPAAAPVCQSATGDLTVRPLTLPSLQAALSAPGAHEARLPRVLQEAAALAAARPGHDAARVGGDLVAEALPAAL
jgi:hypothetical protein